MGEIIYSFRDVSFKYPDGTVALTNLNFEVLSGECIGVVGATGSGKSTLLLLMAGLLSPSNGKIKYKGTNISLYPNLRQEIAILFQNPINQFLNSSVYDEIAYVPRQLGISEDVIKRRVISLAERLDLTELLTRSPFKVSGGEARRVGIAMTLSYSPETILLDEPFSDLSPKYIDIVKEMLRELKEEGKTIVFSSHSLEQMLGLVDKVIILDHGSILRFGDPQSIIRDREFIEGVDLELPCYIKLLNILGIDILADLPLNIDTYLKLIKEYLH